MPLIHLAYQKANSAVFTGKCDLILLEIWLYFLKVYVCNKNKKYKLNKMCVNA